MYTNSSKFVAIADIVPLTSTVAHNLSLINPDESISIKIIKQDIYNEYSEFKFQDEYFVDSFGFRMGPASGKAYQLIITSSNIYVYRVADPNPYVQLTKIINWSVNGTLNTQPGKVLVANATTKGIKVEAQVIEFILQTLQLGTVNEQINIFQIA